jgi:hypothetical protein
MKTVPLRTVSLALAASGLALSAPASAVPASHAGIGAGDRAGLGLAVAGYDDDDYDDDRGRHRGWHKKKHRYDRHARYDRYRSSHRPRAYYNSYPANYGEPVYNNTRVWRGDDGRYYCRKSDGTTGLLIGGAVGALLGREVMGRSGDRTLGAILGAAGGALLGKSVDSKTRCG